MISFLLERNYRDGWGEFDAAAIRMLQQLEALPCCLVPRYFQTPDTARQQVAAGGYLQYSFAMPAGGYLFAVQHSGGGDDFIFQLTDAGLGRPLFSEPVPDKWFSNTAGWVGDNQSRQPWFFAGLYPIVTPGLFTAEFWNPGTSTARCSIVLVVAEVDNTPRQGEQ